MKKISKIFWRKINSFFASELFDIPYMKILYECLKIIISQIVVLKNLFFIDKNLSIFEKNIINFEIWGSSVRKYWGFWVYGICEDLICFNFSKNTDFCENQRENFGSRHACPK